MPYNYHLWTNNYWCTHTGTCINQFYILYYELVQLVTPSNMVSVHQTFEISEWLWSRPHKWNKKLNTHTHTHTSRTVNQHENPILQQAKSSPLEESTFYINWINYKDSITCSPLFFQTNKNKTKTNNNKKEKEKSKLCMKTCFFQLFNKFYLSHDIDDSPVN